MHDVATDGKQYTTGGGVANKVGLQNQRCMINLVYL